MAAAEQVGGATAVEKVVAAAVGAKRVEEGTAAVSVAAVVEAAAVRNGADNPRSRYPAHSQNTNFPLRRRHSSRRRPKCRRRRRQSRGSRGV